MPKPSWAGQGGRGKGKVKKAKGGNASLARASNALRAVAFIEQRATDPAVKSAAGVAYVALESVINLLQAAR